MERERFLARVAAATGTAHLPGAQPSSPGGLVPDMADADLAELFIERLERVSGTGHRSTAERAPELVWQIARSYEADAVLSWDEGELPAPGTLRRLLSEGLRWVDGHVPDTEQGRLEHQLGYMPLVLGLTGATAGLAESGSVVLTSGPGRPRMASVIPLVHVALLDAATIHRSLSHYLAADPAAAADHANLIVVTGPSRTGDIEMYLNLGVHGPKHVHVVILE